MISGKGSFLYKVANVGSVDAVVQLVQRLGLKHVEVKLGDGINAGSASTDPANMSTLIAKLKAAGVEVWGWHYIYLGKWVDRYGVWYETGATPEDEARAAIKWVNAYQLAGYVIDGEKECKGPIPQPGTVNPEMSDRARRFMNTLRMGLPNLPVALCSYRFPDSHREFPWHEFAEKCDFHMPQFYWQPTTMASEFTRSVAQLKAIRDLPILMDGRAYIGDGHAGIINGVEVLAPEITKFLTLSVQSKIQAVTFWGLDYIIIHTGGEARAQAIQAFNWPEPPAPEPPTPTVDERVASLEARVEKLEGQIRLLINNPPQLHQNFLPNIQNGA